MKGFQNSYRDFRPVFHFTPPAMWMNDPNGMVYVDGLYHYCYQYYPNATVWGPMHWGHAVSEDLVHWEHLPVALAPDELGQIFSGSAVYDEQNSSGLGAFGKAPIVALYTSHGECEQQSAAFSLDGVHFEKLSCNPVIPNPGIADFRDPKAFWNPIKNCWGLVLAAQDRVHFYASKNLINWTKTGEFGPEGNKSCGVWECPDLFPLKTETGEEKWVLLVSMGDSKIRREQGDSDTQYFIGSFDGDTFTATEPFEKAEYIDCARDNYAGVTFHNAEDVILVGWANNWAYGNQVPTNEFRGQATFARKLSLVTTPVGLRLAGTPVGIGNYLGTPTPITGDKAISTECFALRVNAEGACEIRFENELGEVLRFGVDEENHLYIDRRNAGISTFSEDFQSEAFAFLRSPRFETGAYQMEILFDISMLEIFMDKGSRDAVSLVYPTVPYSKISVNGGEAVFYPLEK